MKLSVLRVSVVNTRESDGHHRGTENTDKQIQIVHDVRRCESPMIAPATAETRPIAIIPNPIKVCLAAAKLPFNCVIKSLSEASCGIVNNPIARRNDPSAISINHGAVICARPIFFPISLFE